MPGPIIRNPTPAWVKSENASVMDPTVKKIARSLAQLLGMDDPQSQAMGLLNPTPTVAVGIVPKSSLADLIGRFVRDGAPEEYKQAAEFLVKRYPRLMSHVADIEPRAGLNTEDRIAAAAEGTGTVTMGRHHSVGPSVLAKHIQRGARELTPTPTSTISLDSRVMRSAKDHVNTLAHEVTHAAQNLRQTDRAIRSYQAPTFQQEYAQLHELAGYQRNPYERSARETAENQTRRWGMEKLAKMYISNGRDEAYVIDGIQRVFPDAPAQEIAKAINLAKR